MDTKLFQGKLESQGIVTKYDYTSIGAQKNSVPTEFGVYVEEHDTDKAKAIVSEFHALHMPSRKLGLLSLVLVGFIFILFILSRYL